VRLATPSEEGIRASWFLQLGYPGETWAEILATRELVREERPSDVGVSVAYPLPGTVFYERVKSQLGERSHWKDSDDLAMMFAGTVTGPFYKRVRDLLHAEALPGANRDALDARWQVLTHEVEEHRSESPTLPIVSLPAGPA
jgi:anaerobic magnesium-protoporphyrin IX monomethyl ester cyclase